jgi:hypothetical protein
MKDFFLDEFLDHGYFIGCPVENKIWCLSFAQSHFFCLQKSDGPCFYLNNFFYNFEKPFLRGSNFFEFSFEEMKNILSQKKPLFPEIQWDEMRKDFYSFQFNMLKKEIFLKKLKKGVPYSFQEGKSFISYENKVYFLKKLLEISKQKNSYIYGFWKENSGMVGCSPELLFIQRKNYIRTIALAATVPNLSGLNVKKLLLDKKMLQEHQFVLEGILDSLKKFGKIKNGKTKILKLSHLAHLKTDIFLRLLKTQDFCFESFLKELHPTAAVGILPKKSESCWLQKIENKNHSRGYFAAPFGLILDKKKSFCICTIRGLQWDDNKVKVTAGGGVIMESDFDQEWEEIVNKINSIKINLGIMFHGF